MKQRMSLKVFLTKLRKLRGEFVLEESMRMIRTRERFEVATGGSRCICPIEGVARLLGLPIDDNSLGLDRRVRSRIMDAADDNAATGRTRTFRNQMLKALRLQEN